MIALIKSKGVTVMLALIVHQHTRRGRLDSLQSESVIDADSLNGTVYVKYVMNETNDS